MAKARGQRWAGYTQCGTVLVLLCVWLCAGLCAGCAGCARLGTAGGHFTSQALSWINAQQSTEVLRRASEMATRKKLKKRIDERLQLLTGEELQVGVFVAKKILKPGTKTRAVYFGHIDLVYNKNNPDFEDHCCHVIYDDKDVEDFSYSEFDSKSESGPLFPSWVRFRPLPGPGNLVGQKKHQRHKQN